MKKFISVILSALMCTAVFASCASKPKTTETSESSSLNYADSAWLENRLGELPDNTVVGTADKLGIDMTDFQSDGYFIKADNGETVICGKSAEGLDLAVRKYAKLVKENNADVIDISYHEGCNVKELTIAENDISEYTICYPAENNANMLFAVSELQRIIEIACGVKLNAVEGTCDGRKITFAFSEDEALECDGYVYKVENGDLNFCGAVERGCMYGVWRFLENELNWKGLCFGDSVLEEADEINIPEGTEKTEIPAFPYLEFYCYHDKKGCQADNKNDRKTPSSVQNSYGTITRACHGMQINRFCEEDFMTRQICYTDEDRFEECLENVDAYIQKKLNSGAVIGLTLKSVDIAQGDTSSYCDCKTCRAVYKEEGGNSGAVVRFANSLSETLNEKYPGLMYQIFAYAGTNAAPKVTVPNEFIHITFCYDMNCSNHKIDGSECNGKPISVNKRTNKTYAEWLESWTALTKNVYVWYYTLDTGLMAYCMVDDVYYNLRYFYEQGIKGIFYQCASDGSGSRRVEHQLTWQMNWNPDMTEEEYETKLCEALEREYGDGWDYIRDYLDIWQGAQDEVDCWQCWGWTFHSPWDTRFSTNAYKIRSGTSLELMDNAIYYADSARTERHAKTLSASVIYESCYCLYHDAYLNDDVQTIEYLCELYQTMIERLAQCGYRIDHINSVDSAVIAYEKDLVTEAWRWWVAESYGKADYLYGDFYKLTPPVEFEPAQLAR